MGAVERPEGEFLIGLGLREGHGAFEGDPRSLC